MYAPAPWCSMMPCHLVRGLVLSDTPTMPGEMSLFPITDPIILSIVFPITPPASPAATLPATISLAADFDPMRVARSNVRPLALTW